jgi:uncharacterized protein YndB with AHSA1/START domain
MTADQSDQYVDDGRPTVRIERRFRHPIDVVWRAVTTPEQLAQWFPSRVEVDLRPGGTMRFGEFDGPAAHGRVEAVEAPTRLVFTWGTDRLSIELRGDGSDTTLVLTHAFDDRFGAASFATGWHGCLVGLRHVLAGEPAPPADRDVARHEALVHEFGLDRPVVTEDGGRWTVRIERQLTCPADIAWDLWFGVDRVSGEQRGAPGVGEPLTPYMSPDTVLGTVTEVVLHRVLAFDVAPGGGPGDHVRVELGDGTGHGARIVLVVTGTRADERNAAAEMWGVGAIGHLAAQAAAWAVARSS